MVVALAMEFLGLSVTAVTVVYRRLGLLEGERTVETRRRNPETGPVFLRSTGGIRILRALRLATALAMDVFSIGAFFLVSTL